MRGGWFLRHLLSGKPLTARDVERLGTVDVMVLLVDHFEPGERKTDEIAAARVEKWCREYGAHVDDLRDSDGRRPQHTWFYRAEYPNPHCMRILSDQVFRGFGEVEFHLHHGNDDHASFSKRLSDGLDYFNRYGAMLTAEADPQQRFAYIAGNWALDNGGGDDATSGCNTELLALRENGCYADFTFPAIGNKAQPRMVNTIYYAKDDPKPKSYDRGRPLIVGGEPWGDLVIFQGPTSIDWRTGRVDDASLESPTPPAPPRLAAWLRSHVHVKERPEWVFLKLHCHGIQSWDLYKSPRIRAMFEQMIQRWTRPPFRLHFVNAREAYNIAKAAEAGCDGDAGEHRNHVIPPPANRRVRCDLPWRLRRHTPDLVDVEVLGEGTARMDFADGPVRSAEGEFTRIEIASDGGRLERVRLEGSGHCSLDLGERVAVVRSGATYDLRELERRAGADAG